MRKIIASTYATLDGFIDNPHEWSFPYSDERSQQYAFTMTLGADTLLLGRVTYEGMAQAWPNMGGNPYADHVNAIAKYVVAAEPVDTAAWGPVTVIAGDDLVAQVTELKEKVGGDILIWGTGRLTDALFTAGLLRVPLPALMDSGSGKLGRNPRMKRVSRRPDPRLVDPGRSVADVGC
jgi:dihydrofolate reductase